jgi:hypothetical protein
MTKTIHDDNRTAGKMCNLTRNGGHTISAAALRRRGSGGGGGGSDGGTRYTILWKRRRRRGAREIRYTHNDRRLRHYLTLFRRRRCTTLELIRIIYIYIYIYIYI